MADLSLPDSKLPILPSLNSRARYVAMKDSWSHGDDRKDRGRVDRGVTRTRRSRSPSSRHLDSEKEDRGRDRGFLKSRPLSRHNDRPRDISRERRRRRSRTPVRDEVEQVRERNRGRELLGTQGSDSVKRSTHQTSSSIKRRKSRSISPVRSHHKKSRRSRSPSRIEGPSKASSYPDRKRRTPSPPAIRKRSLERRTPHIRSDSRSRHQRDSVLVGERGRTRSPKYEKSDKQESSRHIRDPPPTTKRNRSSHQSPERSPRVRRRSSFEWSKDQDKERRRRPSPVPRRRSPDIDRYEPPHRQRQSSPRAARTSRTSRGDSLQRGRESRRLRDNSRSRRDISTSKRRSRSTSRANKTELKSEKMAGRGYYGSPHNYNPNHQMQAAFPLKPQYNHGPPIDPRQYSQSPQQHITPNTSYHSSPQGHSPYHHGPGNWGGQQPHPQQYSPQPQYPQNYQQQYPNPSGPQSQYYGNQSQSPPYMAQSGPMNHTYPQQSFRGNQRAFRGNHFNSRGGRGDYRGRGGHFQNLHWNAGSAARGPSNHSGNVTPQHVSPQQQFPPASGPHDNNVVQVPLVSSEEDSEDLFRPSKDLQIEDKEDDKNQDDEQMPPPTRPLGTQSQQQNSSKFSFAFKASSKAAPTPPKLEISQKLNAGPLRKETSIPFDRSRGSSQQVPIKQPEFRQPAPPVIRKVKKIMKRIKPRPQLPEEFKTSDSVYFRKPGNESVVGSGTYGKVFKAIHVYTKALVALKKIRMEGERDGFPVTAVREIKLLQSLKHPNVVNLQEVMVEKNNCFMVFEYLSHDLTGLLNHPTFKLDPSHKKHLAKQLFDGLDYLHRRGVLHRDIKAANILVSNDGQLKLADFGLARFYAKRRQLDYTNRVITIWYRSPELLLGETQYGPAVDIWSAACVLVEIFTRHAIFPGDGGEISQLEKIYAILGTPNKIDWPGLVDMAWFELLRPTARRPNILAEKYKDRVTPAAYELLEAMFQYDPAKRPSASDVLEHPYFTTEEPKPRQAIELQKLDGDWHEFESKALRKDNERKDKEARRQAQREVAGILEKERKRGPEEEAEDTSPKRSHVIGPTGISAADEQIQDAN